jgi:hypothetical protein
MIRTLCLMSFLAFSFFSTSDKEQDAYNVAKESVLEKDRTHVLSVYGKGTPTEINTWYIKFFDSDSKTKASVAVVEKGKVIRTHPSEDNGKNDDQLSFDPMQNTVGVTTALETAKKYAKDNLINYDQTRVFLHRTEVGKAPVWNVQLLEGATSKGRVYMNGKDGAFASYVAPGSAGGSSATGSTGQSIGEEVKDTFLDIGGDLENFFTGERTVDKN